MIGLFIRMAAAVLPLVDGKERTIHYHAALPIRLDCPLCRLTQARADRILTDRNNWHLAPFHQTAGSAEHF
jgi:hypothetical protein